MTGSSVSSPQLAIDFRIPTCQLKRVTGHFATCLALVDCQVWQNPDKQLDKCKNKEVWGGEIKVQTRKFETNGKEGINTKTFVSGTG